MLSINVSSPESDAVRFKISCRYPINPICGYVYTAVKVLIRIISRPYDEFSMGQPSLLQPTSPQLA